MKHLFLLLAFIAQFNIISAHSSDVSVSVAMPADAPLDNNSKSILKNKLLQLITAQGIAGTETGAIIIVPEISVIGSSTINGGMRRIMINELEITLSVRNMITNTVFNTIQGSLKGEGYSETEAMCSAISKMNVNAPEYIRFVETSKMKIIDYYNKNITVIITKANAMASQQKYDEALALLATCPESLSGYDKVANAMTSIFKTSQTQYCSQILLSAKAAYSKRNYAEAADIVAMIDAQSSCATEANTLMALIKQNMDKQYNDMVTKEREKVQSAERIRTAQIKAIKDVVTAYLKRQTKFIFY